MRKMMSVVACATLLTACGSNAEPEPVNESVASTNDTGTSDAGVVSAPTAAATPIPAPVATVAEEGLGGKIPIRLGWYVAKGQSCRSATNATKFERDGFWEVSDVPADTFRQRIDMASVSKDKDGYTASFPTPRGGCGDDESCPGGMFVTGIKDRENFTWGVQGDADVHYCEERDVPEKLRRQVTGKS